MAPDAADPLVSVIVPVYNAQRYLDATIRSVLGQDYTRVELVLVDDGSTDDSGAICDRWAAQDDRVRVVHRPNGGIAAAQNSGLDAATGELITFCDNDDLMLPHMVARLVTIMLDADADMSCCRWANVGASVALRELELRTGEPSGRVEVFGEPGRKYQEVFSLAHRKLTGSELQYFSEANWGKLYRASLWEGIRFPEGRYAQDVAVAMDLYSRMSSVASCSDVLYLWLQHAESVSHSSRRTRYFHDIVRAHGHAFDIAVASGIVPLRAYGGMMTLDLERRSVSSPEDAELYRRDEAYVHERVSRLARGQRWRCLAFHVIRRLEVAVYRRTVHRRR